MTTVDLNRIVSELQATRDALSKQLDAIDTAIAALKGASPVDVDNGVHVDAAADVPAETSPPVLPRRVKSKRVLADPHKEALAKGRRRSLAAREAAAGRAREMLDESFVPALAPPSGRQPPRLVKKREP